MKKQILTLLAAILLQPLTSQNDSVYIKRVVDDMDDTEYFFPSKKMIVAAPDKKTGFSVSAFIDKKDEELIVAQIKCVMVNIGSCVENNELTIMFEDGSKINLVSWNKFNCEGDAWFKINSDAYEKLTTLEIKKMRIQNGRSYDSFTADITQDKAYFKQLFYACEHKKIKTSSGK